MSDFHISLQRPQDKLAEDLADRLKRSQLENERKDVIIRTLLGVLFGIALLFVGYLLTL